VNGLNQTKADAEKRSLVFLASAYHSVGAMKKFPERWPLASVGKVGLTMKDLRNGLEPG
jgi:hypothetical protein